MKILRELPAYPKDRDLVRVVAAAADRLARKIDGLDPTSLDLSAETQCLIRDHRDELRAHIDRCARVFAWSLPNDEKPFSDLTLVAFADRLGFFSLLAKECNVGTVVHHDTSDVLRSDAKTIAATIGCPADYYVFGGIEELEFLTTRYSLSCDVFVSCDAIDHFDTLDTFVDSLAGLSTGPMSFGVAVDNTTLSKRTSGSHDTASKKKRARHETTGSYVGPQPIRSGFRLSFVRTQKSGFLGGIRRRVGIFVSRTASSLAHKETAAPHERVTSSFVLCGSRFSSNPSPLITPVTASATVSAPAPDEAFGGWRR